jgi:indolepyruvate ferredoxin oxidoreductase
VTLDDSYSIDSGRIFLSGVQALVRLPLEQRARDRAAGHDTAGFITGYRGSPLGGYDLQLQAARERLTAAHIVFQPGLNEDLAATAVWGTQQAGLLPGAKYDGVFAIWYGKGPGVDRSGDPIKHGNRMGTAKLGGVLLVFGDDHPGKSSTVSHQSEQALAANGVPVLYPASIQEYIDLGLHGFALSRAAGVWVGFKCVNETVETSAAVSVDPQRLRIVEPEGMSSPPEGVHARLAFEPLRDEVRLLRYKLPLAQAYVRANGLDRVTQDASQRELGIVAAGKSWLDVQGALEILGIDAQRSRTLGLRVYKPALIWPLEPHGLREFARGHRELLFIEEKAAFMEAQAAHLLYNLPDRPRLIGKHDEHGAPLLAADVPLDPLDVALLVGARLVSLGLADEALRDRIADLEHASRAARTRPTGVLQRLPYFCAGCPHNTSTRVPEGSFALAGIGCHTMAMGMKRSTLPPTQMGGEGATWAGMAPFNATPHVFQNLGDGTYVHSGLLAVRAAVIAGNNITFKILVNDAVAMTGGQAVEGHFSVAEISQQLRAERVERIAVVSDHIEKYRGDTALARGTTLHDRDELEALQEQLRRVPGVSAIIYEQICAAEKRRRGKRAPKAGRERRLVINERICEGCGDCSVQSNCVAIEPADSVFGRKRRINQSSCNEDYSCAKGFCPSFVSVEGRRRRPAPAQLDAGVLADVPEPARRGAGEFAMLIAGIGGTGVVTIGAILGMAAHLDGLAVSVFDMTGLAQKGGAVFSHLRIAASGSIGAPPRIGMLAADLILGCDLVACTSAEALAAVRSGHTQLLVNTQLVPTAEFQQNSTLDFSAAPLLEALGRAAGEARVAGIDATSAAVALLGDSIGANLFIVGYALQRGVLPVSRQAVERAIELNGVALDFNQRALGLGRLAAYDSARFAALLRSATPGEIQAAAPASLEELAAVHEAELVRYQDAAYARRYRELVDLARAAERSRTPGRSGFAMAVAHSYFKLLAYKDEYEVARLATEEAFRRQLDATFEPGYRLSYHLAPPVLAPKDPHTGVPRKMQLGSWMHGVFLMLRRLKALRGTSFDPFGWTEERRMERRLIETFEEQVRELCEGLTPERHPLAVSLAALAQEVRGYGHIKRRQAAALEARAQALMSEWSAPARG